MDEITEVPHVNDMEDETFQKHADYRHSEDFMAPFEGYRGASTEYTNDVARACHEYWHRADPEKYDHEHLEETQ